MLSVPIGVSGNITQFMAGNIKNAAGGIRPGTPLSLVQVTQAQGYLTKEYNRVCNAFAYGCFPIF